MGGAHPVIRALVIDDELPARSELGFLLDDIDNIQIMGEADNVRDAVALIKSKPVDVIFLDVNMPGVTGIQLAEGLKTHPRPPAIVFVTAHSHFAVRAFELDALDYLVKPVDMGRLRAAVDKVRIRMGLTAGNIASRQGASQMAASEEGGILADGNDKVHIVISKAGKKLPVAVCDISFIMARDDYCYIYTAKERYLSTCSLVKLEEQLKGTGIFRVHRCYLVNLDKVSGVHAPQGGALALSVEGNEETIPVSRRRTSALKEALNL
jgi:two-component system response regulator LytT